MKYKLTRAARRDLAEIEAYTVGQWGMAQAKAYLAMLEERIYAVAETPHFGKQRDDVAQGWRSIRAGSHLIFYRIKKSILSWHACCTTAWISPATCIEPL